MNENIVMAAAEGAAMRWMLREAYLGFIGAPGFRFETYLLWREID
jgi:hypothetical protein